MQRAAKTKDPASVIKSLRRDNPAQANLVKALRKYETFAEEGGWESVTISVDKLELGSSGEDVKIIAARLQAEQMFTGDVAIETKEKTSVDGAVHTIETPLYDDRLEDAVKKIPAKSGFDRRRHCRTKHRRGNECFRRRISQPHQIEP